jgi:8-oxo-dGTP pyrophosphatase MutT (NUDIX family)
MIEAAGGVVWRTGHDGQIEVAVIHRPRRRDWSLPKGKREGGETLLDCAVREVREETGLVCDVGDPLAMVEYRHRSGRRKVVHYWTMRSVDGSFRPNAEVDALRWVSISEARALLTRSRDVEVVDQLVDQLVDRLAVVADPAR